MSYMDTGQAQVEDHQRDAPRRVRLRFGRRRQGVRRHRRQGAARVDERAPLAAPSLRGRPRGGGRRGRGRGEAVRVDGGGTESDEERRRKVVRCVPARPRMSEDGEVNEETRTHCEHQFYFCWLSIPISEAFGLVQCIGQFNSWHLCWLDCEAR